MIKMADILSEEKLWWHGYHNITVAGSTCIMLAAETIEPGGKGVARALRMLGLSTKKEDKHNHVHYVAATNWNDAPKRTWAEVQDFIRRFDEDRMNNP